jgi:hypothetical protein
MNRILLLSLSLAALLVPLRVNAQIALQINPLTPIPPLLLPSQSFSVDLQLVNSSNPDIVSYDYAVELVDTAHNPVSGVAILNGLSDTSAVLSQLNTPGLNLPAALNPQVGTSGNPTDLGAITPNSSPDAGLGEGTFDLETLTFSIGANAPTGTYELELFEPSPSGAVTIYDDSFDDVATAAGPQFSSAFQVEDPGTVPEPGTWQLMLAGVGLLVLFRRIRARA